MSEPSSPITTLQYAIPAEQLLPPARPAWLLVPNLASGALAFLPVTWNEPPVLYMWEWVPPTSVHRWALVSLLGGYLFHLLVAAWTTRLTWRPTPPHWERLTAACLTACAAMATIFTTAFTAHLGGRYGLAALFAAVVLVLGMVMTVMARKSHPRGYPEVLVAATLAAAAHGALSVGIQLADRAGWSPLLFFAAVVAACQTLAAGGCVRLWRRQAASV